MFNDSNTSITMHTLLGLAYCINKGYGMYKREELEN